jgi:lipopolysaccharide transport system ATP-binding protein
MSIANHTSPEPADEQEVLVRVSSVSKKFCLSLKQSLWYGLADMAGEFNPVRKSRGANASSNGTSAEGHLRPGEFWAVNDVSFELRRGECIGLIGHNGAGKTTLLKMLNGLIKPDVGSITMRGKVGALIALGAGFNPILTGRENIYVNGSVLGLSKQEIDERLEEIIDFADIREFIDTPTQNYSSGMAVRLGFAIAAHCQPDVLLLDEVLAVGDVAFQAKCFNKLAEFRRLGVAFILVSHSTHQISRYCQKVVFMKHGRMEYFGNTEEGIGRFLGDIQGSGMQQSPGPDWSVVHGTGAVVFTGAQFIGADGHPVESIKAGDPLTFAVSFKKHREDVVDPVFDVVVRCRGEMVYQSTNRNHGVQLGALPGEGRLLLQFRSLPMNGGPLDFYFCLLDGATGELFDWKRDLRLNVRPDALQSGSICLDAEWRLADP